MPAIKARREWHIAAAIVVIPTFINFPLTRRYIQMLDHVISPKVVISCNGNQKSLNEQCRLLDDIKRATS